MPAVAVLGLGNFGRWWTQVVAGHPGVRLAAMIDPDPTARWLAGEHAQAPTYACLEDALAEGHLDAAVIASPPSCHEDDLGRVLGAGMAAIKEKPLAADWGAALRIARLARPGGPPVLMAQDYRFMPAVRTLREALRAGWAGEPGAVRHTFTRDHPLSGWRAQMPDPLLRDMAVHHMDLLRYALGTEFDQVFAHSFRPAGTPYRGDSAAHVLLRATTGLKVCYTANWTARGRQTDWCGDLEIDCAYGSLALRDGGVCYYPREERCVPGEGHPVPQAHVSHQRQAGLLQAMLEGLTGGRLPQPDIRDNLRSYAIVEAAALSAAQGRPVDPGELLEAAGHEAPPAALAA